MNKRKHSSGRIVFLLDVDNTLLDNDGVQADLRASKSRMSDAIALFCESATAYAHAHFEDPPKIANWIWADVEKQKN